jgi:hypothetical protein
MPAETRNHEGHEGTRRLLFGGLYFVSFRVLGGEQLGNFQEQLSIFALQST